jgi:hypothetical protein
LTQRALDWAWHNYFAGAGARRVAAEQQKKERERRDAQLNPLNQGRQG